MPVTGGYIIFLLLGYLLSITRIKRSIRYVIYVFGLLCVCIRYFGTLILSVNEQSLVTTFWGYLNLPSVGLAVAVFVWFKHQNWDWIANNKVLAAIVS